MKRKIILEIIGYLLISYLSYSFFIHGYQAIIGNPGFISLVMSIGFSFAVAKILVLIAGIADILISILLFVYKKPIIVLYATFWPLVPALITLFTSGHFNWNYLIYTLSGIIIYGIFYFPYKSRK